MGFFKSLFGGTRASLANSDLMKVLDLRERQGWKIDFVPGEVSFIMKLLDKGFTPEEIAKVSLQENWPFRSEEKTRGPGGESNSDVSNSPEAKKA